MPRKFILLTLTMIFLAGGYALRAQDSGALIDLLVRKKIITDQEAEELRTELTKEYASTGAGKLKLSTPITELELYGDARMRYEIRSGQNTDDDTQQRNRHRYRMRLGLRGTLADDWFFGIRLESSSSARSTNVTFADDTSSGSGATQTFNGPFAKGNDGLHIGQAYLGYRGFKDITLTAGKMPNPLITTSMVWDGDINPEGLAQQYKHTFTLNFGGGETGSAVESYSKDGKAVAATTSSSSEPWALKIDVFANFGQFIYDDTNPENVFGNRLVVDDRLVPSTDAYLLAWQAGARFTFPNNIHFQAAPTLYNYTGHGDTFNRNFVGDPGANQVAVNDLLVFEVPLEIGWRVKELPMRLFADLVINLEGDERARAAGRSRHDDEVHAYQVGLSLGQLKVKRDWQITVFWQHAEQFSLDPNLIDSDIFDSRVNMEGFGIQLGYAITDAIVFNLTYAAGDRINHRLGTAGTGDIGTNPLEDYQIFQADLNVKF